MAPVVRRRGRGKRSPVPQPARIEYEPQVNLATRVPQRLHDAIRAECLRVRLSQREWLVALLERTVGQGRRGGRDGR